MTTSNTGTMVDGEHRRFSPTGEFIGAFDKNGNLIEDGQSVRVPMILMDGKTGRVEKQVITSNHIGVRDDAQKAQVISAHKKMVDRVTGAWKRDHGLTPEQTAFVTPGAMSAAEQAAFLKQIAGAGNDTAYEQRKATISSRWRGAK